MTDFKFYEDIDTIRKKLEACTKIYYVYCNKDDNGFSIRNSKQIFEVIRERAIIKTLSGPHEMVVWYFYDIQEGSHRLIDQDDVNSVLQFIEDKFGQTIDELSLGYMTYQI